MLTIIRKGKGEKVNGEKVNGVEKRELNLRFSSRKSKLTLKKKNKKQSYQQIIQKYGVNSERKDEENQNW